MRVKALVLRILRQMRRDRRTLALMLVAPLILLTLIYLLLNGASEPLKVAVISAPESYLRALEQFDVQATRTDEGEAERLLAKREVTAAVSWQSGKLKVLIDGSDAARASKLLAHLEAAKAQAAANRPDLRSDIDYIYGYEDMSQFDNFGAAFIGILIFFFVFLVAGIAFLQERTTGTLEKLLSAPIKRGEIVLGYMLGYGLITVVQTIIVSLFVIYVLDIMLVGSLLLVLAVTFLTALCALTLGILLSTVANSEFQMMQFIPLVIVPQIFLCGLFDLSGVWNAIGHFVPLYYSAEALREVMLRGGGLMDIGLDLLVLTLFCFLFMFANIKVLKKYRSI